MPATNTTNLLASTASFWDRLWWGGHTETSSFAGGVDAVFFYIFWISLAFFVVLMALMVVFAVKYKRTPGTHAPVSSAHNTPLEISWTVIPLILFAIMFFWGLHAYLEMQVAPVDSEEIQVTAQQWGWSWEYDNGGTSQEFETIADATAPVFALPVGRPVKFVMSSQDVIHSLYIPAFRAKRDIFPNRYTSIWVEATEATHTVVEEGNSVKSVPIDPTNKGYYLACTEYCGDNHSQMWARVVTMTDADYRKWKNAQASTDNIPLVELGALLWKSKGCNACHSVDGSAKTGPTWKGLWGTDHAFQDGSTVLERYDSYENYIRESILIPDKYIVEGYANQMASYQGRVTDRELRAISTYIQSLSDDAADREAAMAESQQEAEERGIDE